MAAGAALAAKRGEMPKKALQGASKSMAGSMSEKQLEELAHTKRKSLPKSAGGAESTGKKLREALRRKNRVARAGNSGAAGVVLVVRGNSAPREESYLY